MYILCSQNKSHMLKKRITLAKPERLPTDSNHFPTVSWQFMYLGKTIVADLVTVVLTSSIVLIRVGRCFVNVFTHKLVDVVRVCTSIISY